MEPLNRLIKILKGAKPEVTDQEWSRLSKMLDNRDASTKKPKVRTAEIVKRWAVAASILLVVGAGFLFILNSGSGLVEGNLAQHEEAIYQQPRVALASSNYLSHRSDMVVGDASENRNIDRGTKPYKATLPNGDSWLVQMKLIRDVEHCEARISSINDKAVKLELDVVDEECSEFKSGKTDAAVKLSKVNGEDRIILVLNGSHESENGPLSLELQRIY